MFSPTRLLTPAGKTPGRYPSLCQHPQAPSAPAPRAVPGFLGHSVFNQPKRTPTSAGRTAVGGVAARCRTTLVTRHRRFARFNSGIRRFAHR
ncbi:hypothetical protein HYQ46_001337 [Verticillium longisporum]|nr:hypothetical protein HYQ46_001337 [Verticillium longisporum]